MSIGEVLMIDRDTAPIMEQGMHCMGCPFLQTETLEMGCAAHGSDADELVRKLNEFFAGKAIQMVDNFIPYFDMQEQIDKLPKKNVEGQLEALCADLAARKTAEVVITEETKAQMAMYHHMLADKWLLKDTALTYTVDDSCVRCGICMKVCPAKNITVTAEGVRFSDHCEVCYACLHNCPQHAIHMPLEAGTTQFRNEHVTLKDIIESNQ